MNTYQVTLSVEGIGWMGLILFTCAIILQIIFFVVFGLIAFLIGFIMFMVGGWFGRSIQKHYNQGISKDMVGISVHGNYRFWSWASVLMVFPLLWVVYRIVHHRYYRYLYFPVLHLSGGELWW